MLDVASTALELMLVAAEVMVSVEVAKSYAAVWALVADLANYALAWAVLRSLSVAARLKRRWRQYGNS